METYGAYLRDRLDRCVQFARSNHRSACFFYRAYCRTGLVDTLRHARFAAGHRDYWMSQARECRAALAVVSGWSSPSGTHFVRDSASSAPSVRVVSAVPVSPVQLTLAGGVDPVPVRTVRPSWYSRYSDRTRGRYLPGRCL